MPYLSVVIPTYNHGRYLGRAVDSVLTQGCGAELVIVDDGSTDDTPARLAPYADRARIIRTVNRGAPAARNTGIAVATGEAIVVLDADDRFLPGALEDLQRALVAHPALQMVCGGHVSVREDGRRKIRAAPPLTGDRRRDFAGCVRGTIEIQNGAVAVRRAIYARHRYNEAVRTCDDVVFYAQLVALYPCGTIARALVEKFAHPGRLRDDYATVVRDSLKAAELLFDHRVLPVELMSYRRAFLARQLLTAFRAHYRHGKARLAGRCYASALRADPLTALRWASLRKALRLLPGLVWTAREVDAAA